MSLSDSYKKNSYKKVYLKFRESSREPSGGGQVSTALSVQFLFNINTRRLFLLSAQSFFDSSAQRSYLSTDQRTRPLSALAFFSF